MIMTKTTTYLGNTYQLTPKKELKVIGFYCYNCGSLLEGEGDFSSDSYWAYLECTGCLWSSQNYDEVMEFRQVAFDELMRNPH